MSFISDKDPEDPLSIHSPPLTLDNLVDNSNSLEGIKIGIYNQWYEDAPKGIVSACNQMLEYLEERGAEVIRVIRILFMIFLWALRKLIPFFI